MQTNHNNNIKNKTILQFPKSGINLNTIISFPCELEGVVVIVTFLLAYIPMSIYMQFISLDHLSASRSLNFNYIAETSYIFGFPVCQVDMGFVRIESIVIQFNRFIFFIGALIYCF